MNVTILGATGSMGREITSQLIRSRALAPREVLQLAANPGNPQSVECAHGIRRDLQDAYAELMPEVQVISHAEQVIGDIVVVAAGRTLRATADGAGSRDELEEAAHEVCDRYAAVLAQRLCDLRVQPIFVVVTNPVELVVQRFAAELGRRMGERGNRHVVGMGGYSDSLRFQWEIAHDLGVVRDRISAQVMGEHGLCMIPRWSTVQLRGMPEDEQQKRLGKLYERDAEAAGRNFGELLQERKARVDECIRKEVPKEEILREIESYRPDFRVALKPLVVHSTGSKTAHVTGAAGAGLIQAILEGKPFAPILQRMVHRARDAGGRRFAFGVPTLLSELFRPSAHDDDPLASLEIRSFVGVPFRAEREGEEQERLVTVIAEMQRKSARWSADPRTP